MDLHKIFFNQSNEISLMLWDLGILSKHEHDKLVSSPRAIQKHYEQGNNAQDYW